MHVKLRTLRHPHCPTLCHHSLLATNYQMSFLRPAADVLRYCYCSRSFFQTTQCSVSVVLDTRFVHVDNERGGSEHIDVRGQCYTRRYTPHVIVCTLGGILPPPDHPEA